MNNIDLLKKDKPLKSEPIDYHLHHLKIALDSEDITKQEFDDYIDELYLERCL